MSTADTTAMVLMTEMNGGENKRRRDAALEPKTASSNRTTSPHRHENTYASWEHSLHSLSGGLFCSTCSRGFLKKTKSEKESKGTLRETLSPKARKGGRATSPQFYPPQSRAGTNNEGAYAGSSGNAKGRTAHNRLAEPRGSTWHRAPCCAQNP